MLCGKAETPQDPQCWSPKYQETVLVPTAVPCRLSRSHQARLQCQYHTKDVALQLHDGSPFPPCDFLCDSCLGQEYLAFATGSSLSWSLHGRATVHLRPQCLGQWAQGLWDWKPPILPVLWFCTCANSFHDSIIYYEKTVLCKQQPHANICPCVCRVTRIPTSFPGFTRSKNLTNDHRDISCDLLQVYTLWKAVTASSLLCRLKFGFP